MGSRNRFMTRKQREERSKNSPYTLDPSKLFGNIPQRAKDAVLGAVQNIPYGPVGAIVGAGTGLAAGEFNRATGLVKLGDVPRPKEKPQPAAPAPAPSATGRDEVRSSGTGTRTGPAPAKFDGTAGMDAFISKLQSEPYGINFPGRERAPMESTNLPSNEEAIAAGAYMGGGGTVTPEKLENYSQIVKSSNSIGGYLAGKMGDEYNTTNKPGVTESLQSGIDAGKAADRNGAGRLSAALADKEGMRSYMDRAIKDGLAENDGTGPMSYANDGLDARSRAFLDYNGKGGSLMALRAADAAQGTVYAGGKLYDVSGKNSEGKYNVVDREGREFLKANRNATTAGQAYKDAFMQRKDLPEQDKGPSEVMPEFSTRADYQQLSQRDFEGTLVMGENDKIEPFETGMNRSTITGAPSDVDGTNYFADPRSGEPIRRGFLPTEEEKAAMDYFTVDKNTRGREIADIASQRNGGKVNEVYVDGKRVY